MLTRWAIFLYGVASYAIFFLAFLYAIGFLGNSVVPLTLDGEPALPFWQALSVNLGVLSLFAALHSVMMRTGFGRTFVRGRRSEALTCCSRARALSRCSRYGNRSVALSGACKTRSPVGAVCAVRGLGARARFDVRDQPFSTVRSEAGWLCLGRKPYTKLERSIRRANAVARCRTCRARECRSDRRHPSASRGSAASRGC